MNFKLPKLMATKEASSARRSARPRFTMPGPVDDLYRDMRDRRLLLPALCLIIAIIAVPVALSAQQQDPPEPLAFVAPEGAEAVAPAVLAEKPAGVRDYHERLAQLKSKNPFAEQFKAPKEPSPDPAATETGSTATTPADTGGASPVDSSPTPGEAGEQPSIEAPPQPPDTEPDRVLLAPRIDVFAGLKGNGRKMRGVEGGDLVPSKKTAPVLIFLGTNGDLTEAKFVASRDVTATEGDGSCRPKRRNCEFLSMKEGEKQFFTFGPRDREYIVRVVRIYEEVVDRQIQTD